MKREISSLFPIIDDRLKYACAAAAQKGEAVQCQKGCSSCCYLLPAVTWEEAELLGTWVRSRPPVRQSLLRKRIAARALDTRTICSRRPSWRIFSRPTRTSKEIPDSLCNEYFLLNNGCPFLVNRSCSAYESRPTVCRLHLVSSKRAECSRRKGIDGEVHTPGAIEQVQKHMLGRARQFARDGRWGQLAVMVEAVLEHQDTER